MAFEWLSPILTPDALATVQSQPFLLAILLAVIIFLVLLSVLCWYISYRTEKNNGTYKPMKFGNPFSKAEQGKGGAKGGARGGKK